LALFKLIEAYSLSLNTNKLIFLSVSTFLILFYLLFTLFPHNDLRDIVYLLYTTFDAVIVIPLIGIYFSFKRLTIATKSYLIIATGFFALFLSDFFYFINLSLLSELSIINSLNAYIIFGYALSFILLTIGFLDGLNFKKSINENIKKALQKRLKNWQFT
jgi:hypothetical protein